MQIHIEPNPGKDSPGVVRMVVIPRDSGNKYEYDLSLGPFPWGRASSWYDSIQSFADVERHIHAAR